MPKVTNVELYCPYCTNRLETDISYRGHQISCQGCGQLIVVPVHAKEVVKPLGYPAKLGLIFLGISLSLWALNTFSDFSQQEVDTKEPTIASDEASPEQRNHISSALGERYAVHDCRVIQNRDEYGGYFFAARFSYEGIEKHEEAVGVWWIGGTKTDPTLIASINEPAYTHSRMGWASKSKRGYTMATPEAAELLKALTK
ncbi:hypothetical protein N9057_02365 [Akkermansiaceae bacterium]|nr:hypothetical protein [Akkermansiaceae bacterium]